MSNATWSVLRQMLVEEYDDFRRILARRLGSIDLAGDALQDTFVRLARGGEVAGPVQNPRNYLFRMAINFATSRSRNERRRLNVIEADAVLDAIDEQPGPEAVAEGASDMRALARVLAEMPPRRRAIFEAAWIEDMPHREIAARHNLSLRMIQIELKHAADHVALRMDVSRRLISHPAVAKRHLKE